MTLPGPGLVVAPNPLAGSAAAGAFEQSSIVMLDELAGSTDLGAASSVVLVAEAVADLMPSAVAEVAKAARPGNYLLIGLADERAWARLRLDSDFAKGYQAVAAVSLGSATYLALRFAGTGTVPDLEEYADPSRLSLGRVAMARTELPPASPEVELSRLRQQVDDLSKELAVAHAALLKEQAADTPHAPAFLTFLARGRFALKSRGLITLLSSKTIKRLLLPVVLAFVGLLLIAGVGVLVGLTTHSGYGGFGTALALLMLLIQLYIARATRRAARNTSVTNRVVHRVAEAQQSQGQGLRRQTQAFERKLVATGGSVADLARSQEELRKSVEGLGLQASRQYTQAVQQSQAIENLFEMFDIQDVVPFMGGWAASADLVLTVLEEIRLTRPRVIVECGSGTSTLWMALAIRKYGLQTALVALEHQPSFAATTRELLARHGVSTYAEVRDAPLQPTGIDGHGTPWYAAAAVEDLHGIGLVFVDGPPDAVGPQVRYPAVPLLRDRFDATVTIVVDDLGRSSEREMVARWERELPDFTLIKLDLEKGAALFRRSAPTA